MTRLEKMQAVVDAARKWRDEQVHHGIIGALYPLYNDVSAALLALDADADAEAGETVTLAVWEFYDGGVRFSKPGSVDDKWPGATRLGTVTLPLDRERGA